MVVRRNPEATRNAILDAAEQLFLQKGAGETSVSALAKKAGVTKSLVHYHFETKEALWEEVKRRFFNKYWEMQKAMLTEGRSSSHVQLLRDSILAYYQALKEKPNFSRLICWMHLDGDTACGQAENQINELGKAKLEEAQASGAFRNDILPESMIMAFMSLVEHWFLLKERICDQHEQEDPHFDREAFEQRYLDDMLKIFFEGIGGRGK